MPNPSRILTQQELGSKIPVRITSCRPISNFPINYKSHNPHNCIKIKTTTSNTSLPSLFISNARSLVNKIDELSSTVSNYSADIVVITETWLSNNVDNSVIVLNGFSTFRYDRPDGRRGGGVCVYVNNRFPVFHLEDISVPDIESIWLLLKPSRLPRGFNSIILGAIYHPPRNDDRSLLAHIMESLDRALASNPGAAVILTGDFNQFKHRQLCSSFSLKQIVKRPTRGSNVLDKIFTNVSKFYNVPDVVPPVGFSDHNSILLTPLNHCKNSRTVRFIRDAHHANRSLIAEILSHINWSPMYHMNSCNDQFQYFSSVVNDIIEKYLPLKRMKVDSSDKPWISPEIKVLISKRQAAWNSGNMDAFRLYRNKINALCKSARSRYYNDNVANSLQSNPHKWWSTVKKIAGLAPSNNICTVIYNGKSYSDSDLANLLNDKFVAVGNTLPPFTWTPLAIDDVPSDFYISVDDTEKALESLKRHTSVGPDGIPSWFLRENASLISRPLASIFNASIHEGFVPPLWKCANVTPIPKCFPISNIDSDVRPISLTPIVSKILESFLYNWLLQSIDDHIDNLQFGSIRKSSTTMALIYMLHKWYEAMDTPGTLLRICMLDFSKAFDRIDFNILSEKLHRMGVHPVLINWIANFLTDRKQRTRIENHYSSWKTINAGVPQGTKLGPLLFLIMVNDLSVSPDTVKFVDDTTIWEIIRKSQTFSSVLPAQINECTNWVLQNNMKLNPQKTKEIQVRYSSSDTEPPLPITINGHEITLVPHAKLLGVIISKDLKWILHVDYICKKAAKRLYALRLLKRCSVPTDKLVRVFITCIRPVLEYSCEVWHYSLPQYLSDEIERIQRRALRIIFPELTYSEAMDRANVVTLFQRRNNICARFFNRIYSDTSHKLHGLIPPRHETPYHLRKNNCIEIPRYETNRFLNSFIIAASKRHNDNNN